MTKYTIAIAASLFLAIGCSSSDNNDPVDLPDTSNPGENMDASGGDATGGTPDAALPALSAADLGKVCSEAAGPCPEGYACLVGSDAPGAAGFCSLPCPTGGMPAGCDGAAGFAGPGAGLCVFNVGSEAAPELYCGVLCGADFGGDACPTGLTCTNLGQASACLPPE